METYRCDNCNYDKCIIGPEVEALNGGNIVKCANCGAYMYRSRTGDFSSIVISDRLIDNLDVYGWGEKS